MKALFQTIDKTEWPQVLLVDLAMITQEPHHLESSLGITFFRDYDDLDYYKAVCLKLARGEIFALHNHENSPVRGCAIMIREQQQDPLKLLPLLLEAIACSENDLLWINPEINSGFNKVKNHIESDDVSSR